ncbi:MAG TPA: sigma 54-interacting transcriptional regulator [Polyangiaceae bacterium]
MSASDASHPGPFDDVETIQQKGYTPSKPSGAFVIRVERGRGAPTELRIDGAAPAPQLVGKSPVCSLHVEDSAVSRRHLALELGSGGLLVRDLGSKNGTRVDGVRVAEAVLEGGERIEIGETILRVEPSGAAAPLELPDATEFGRVVGASTAMRRLYPLFARLAASNIPVVIEGETGTGKEALAEALHSASPRSSAPFVVFDCTAASPNLVESELFGHERGAFTGAIAARPGVFQQADGGTLLIDEIGDLEASLQPKLLRAIERSEIRPLGSARTVRVDVRLIAATRRDLDREVQEGRFRDDLFHRLAVARVELPPLRRRQGDVEALTRRFWHELALASGHTAEAEAGPPAALIRRFEREAWPGNVRQLRNAVARTLALGGADASPLEWATEATDVPAGRDFVQKILAERLPLPIARERVVAEFERRYIEEILERHGGSVTRAAKESGIALRYFQLLRKRRTP